MAQSVPTAMARSAARPAVDAAPRITGIADSSWAKLSRLCRLWAARRRERFALRDLDDHMLRDIGVTRQHAEREAGLPFWER